jgi:hypothetical protein
MAAPNLIGATTITGKTVGVSITTTAATTLLSNAASSGKCLKINTLNVANYSGAAVQIYVSWYNGANVTGTAFIIIGPVVVPAGSTLNVIDKTSQYYLEENTSLGITSFTANTLHVTTSYEDIS